MISQQMFWQDRKFATPVALASSSRSPSQPYWNSRQDPPSASLAVSCLPALVSYMLGRPKACIEDQF